VQSFIGAALAVPIGCGLEQARFVEMITASTGQLLAMISRESSPVDAVSVFGGFLHAKMRRARWVQNNRCGPDPGRKNQFTSVHRVVFWGLGQILHRVGIRNATFDGGYGLSGGDD
jgi:hypothetical protein